MLPLAPLSLHCPSVAAVTPRLSIIPFTLLLAGSEVMKAGAPKGMIASSPGRGAEKLPAPALVSLLRGKGGSRSRGRAPLSRASPMFVARRRGGGGAPSSVGGEVGEPSSPKVTCIGQVRIRNKKKGSKPSKPKASRTRWAPLRCRCFFRAVICNPFSWKPKFSRARRPLCGRWWVLPLRSRGQSKYQQRKALEEVEDCSVPPLETVPRGSVSDGDDGDDSEEEEEEEEDEAEAEAETRVFVSSATTTPPKNALLLMRCRSAPHNRASSLASRFWVSPLVPSESATGEEAGLEGKEGTEEEGRGSCNESLRDGDRDEELERCSSPTHPSVLTRSKSEPARKAAKLIVPEAPYLNTTSNRRRLTALAQEKRPPPLRH